MSESFPRAFQSWRDRAYKETDDGAREEGGSARAAGTTTARRRRWAPAGAGAMATAARTAGPEAPRAMTKANTVTDKFSHKFDFFTDY